LRIIYLNPIGALGGGERSLLDLLAAMRQADTAASLHLITGEEGPLLDQAQALGVETHLLPMPPELLELGTGDLAYPGGLWPLFALARRGLRMGMAARRYGAELRHNVAALEPDIVHSNGIKFHLLTRWARLHQYPVLWHLRDFLGSRPLLATPLRWAATAARGAIAISLAIAQDAQALLSRLPIEVVYNAVDTTYFSPGAGDGQRLDDLAGLAPAPPATIRIGLPATFAHWKGHDVFLTAAAELVRRQPPVPVRFYIIGGPIYHTSGSQISETDLRQKAARVGIAERVGFIPFQQNMAGIYRTLDVVIHASTRPEPFGRTIVEAMACGRPVIVSRAGGAAELFTHDHDAFGTPPGDSAALAAAMYRLLVNPEARSRLAANARRTAETRFPRERLGEEILSLYRRNLPASRRLTG
jgi:glycosyltransferase involved in cell wall biosynthesis